MLQIYHSFTITIFLCNKINQPVSNLETRLIIRYQTNFAVNPKTAHFTQIKANFCRWSSNSLKVKESFTDFNCSTRYNVGKSVGTTGFHYSMKKREHSFNILKACFVRHSSEYETSDNDRKVS